MNDRVMRLDEVKAVTGLGKSMIYKLLKNKSFPGSIKLSERCVGWRESEIRGWVESRLRSR
jgi:prophage regulatory protein